MKKFLAVVLIVGFSSLSNAATEKFTACASYNKDSKVQIVIQDEKLIDFTVYFLSEAGTPSDITVKTKVSDAVVVTAEFLTPQLVDFLKRFGVNDVVGGKSYAATSILNSNERFIFDNLIQKSNGKAVVVTHNGNLLFIGSSLNCK